MLLLPLLSVCLSHVTAQALNWCALATGVMLLLFTVPMTYYAYRLAQSEGFNWLRSRIVGWSPTLRCTYLSFLVYPNRFCCVLSRWQLACTLASLHWIAHMYFFIRITTVYFRDYQRYLTAVKVDLQFNLGLVTLGGFLLFDIHDATLWLNVIVLLLTFVWAWGSVKAVRLQCVMLLCILLFVLFCFVCCFV